MSLPAIAASIPNSLKAGFCHEKDADEYGDIDQRRSHIRLDGHQKKRDQKTPQNWPELGKFCDAVFVPLGLCGHDACKCQDEPDLGEFAGLETAAADHKPTGGAVLRGSEEIDGDQQADADPVDIFRVVPKVVVVDQHDQKHQTEARTRKNIRLPESFFHD